MKFLKKLGKVLFGSAKPKKPVKVKAKKAQKKAVKPSKKKATKPAKKKSVKTAKKVARQPIKKMAARPKGKPSKAAKKAGGKKQTVMVKEALAALPVAEVTHYFPHVKAAVLKIKSGDIRVGDKLHFKGHTTNFIQKVLSMQIDHQSVLVARKGDDFGVEVKSRVRAGDLVTKI